MSQQDHLHKKIKMFLLKKGELLVLLYLLRCHLAVNMYAMSGGCLFRRCSLISTSGLNQTTKTGMEKLRRSPNAFVQYKSFTTLKGKSPSIHEAEPTHLG